MSNNNRDISRRRTLQKIGATGIGSAGFGVFTTTSVAASDDRLNEIWDELIDLAYDKIADGVTPWGQRYDGAEYEDASVSISAQNGADEVNTSIADDEDDEVTTESIADDFLSLVNGIPSPTDLPMDVCVEYDKLYEADKLCFKSTDIWDGTVDACPGNPNLYTVGLEMWGEEKGFRDGWGVSWSNNVWVGFDKFGCVYAGMDDLPMDGPIPTPDCALLDCPSRLVNPVVAPVRDVAEIAFDMASSAVEEISDLTGLPTILVWIGVILAAILIVYVSIKAAIIIGGSGGAAILAREGVRQLGRALGKAWV